MYFLFASSLRLTPLGLALKIAPGDFVRDWGVEVLALMYMDVMYCMPVLQEQKPATKKLLFLETSFR